MLPLLNSAHREQIPICEFGLGEAETFAQCADIRTRRDEPDKVIGRIAPAVNSLPGTKTLYGTAR